MDEYAGHWCPIENDPQMFTWLIKNLGANGVLFKDLWPMEHGKCDPLRPVHGLIFIYKYVENEPPTSRFVIDPQLLQKIYFAEQITDNASATQAVISLLLNCNHPDLNLGSLLTNLKEDSRTLDPKMRAMAIGNSPLINAAHNAIARHENLTGNEEFVYHCISYIPIDGRIYELDGLWKAPIDHGPVPAAGRGRDWTDVIKSNIAKRIKLFSDVELRFSLFGLVSDLDRKELGLWSLIGMQYRIPSSAPGIFDIYSQRSENARNFRNF